jgi:uncharacterized protein YheU (UPF0270 family)
VADGVPPEREQDERFVFIDRASLSPEAFRGLIEEFVTREGTDYGRHEKSFEDKLRDVERQIDRGEARIVYDLVEEQANIVPTKGKPPVS